MDVGIIVAMIGFTSALLVSLVNVFSIKKINGKLNNANVKKINAEADNIIFELKNKTIEDLQSQINELKKDIDQLKTREHIHIQEKVRLESQLAELRGKNLALQRRVSVSNEEIETLNQEIIKLKKTINNLKKRGNDISDSRSS